MAALTCFQELWRLHAQKLGLRIEAPFVLSLSSKDLVVPILLRDFGAANGMLLVTDYATVPPHLEEIDDLGYRFSTLSEPTERQATPDDAQALVDMLNDWGWSGPGSPPAWYSDGPG